MSTETPGLAFKENTIVPAPAPVPVLPPLPWWKDGNRVNGEAQNILDALRAHPAQAAFWVGVAGLFALLFWLGFQAAM